MKNDALLLVALAGLGALVWYTSTSESDGSGSSFDWSSLTDWFSGTSGANTDENSVPVSNSSGFDWSSLFGGSSSSIGNAIMSFTGSSASWKTNDYPIYAAQISSVEQAQGIPTDLLARLLYQESAYLPAIIDGTQTSSVGAIGIAQFMPATALDLGVDPTDPVQSIAAAGKYLKQLYNATGDWQLALAAYNWGLGNVQRKGIAAAPQETQNYVAQITADVPVA